MPQYVRLARLTEDAARTPGMLPKALGDARAVMEKHGVRIISAYALQGEWDVVALLSAPDNETMLKASALVAANGHFKAVTMPVLSIRDALVQLQQAGATPETLIEGASLPPPEPPGPRLRLVPPRVA